MLTGISCWRPRAGSFKEGRHTCSQPEIQPWASGWSSPFPSIRPALAFFHTPSSSSSLRSFPRRRRRSPVLPRLANAKGQLARSKEGRRAPHPFSQARRNGHRGGGHPKATTPNAGASPGAGEKGGGGGGSTKALLPPPAPPYLPSPWGGRRNSWSAPAHGLFLPRLAQGCCCSCRRLWSASPRTSSARRPGAFRGGGGVRATPPSGTSPSRRRARRH